MFSIFTFFQQLQALAVGVLSTVTGILVIVLAFRPSTFLDFQKDNIMKMKTTMEMMKNDEPIMKHDEN